MPVLSESRLFRQQPTSTVCRLPVNMDCGYIPTDVDGVSRELAEFLVYGMRNGIASSTVAISPNGT